MGSQILSFIRIISGVIYFKYFLSYLFYLVLSALGLRCCTWAFPSCGEWGPLLVAVHGSLIAGASPVEKHGLQAHGPSSCGTRAQQLWHTGSRAQAPQQVGSSWTRARTPIPCIGRGILNHCTTREAPQVLFKMLILVPIP